MVSFVCAHFFASLPSNFFNEENSKKNCIPEKSWFRSVLHTNALAISYDRNSYTVKLLVQILCAVHHIANCPPLFALHLVIINFTKEIHFKKPAGNVMLLLHCHSRHHVLQYGKQILHVAFYRCLHCTLIWLDFSAKNINHKHFTIQTFYWIQASHKLISSRYFSFDFMFTHRSFCLSFTLSVLRTEFNP